MKKTSTIVSSFIIISLLISCGQSNNIDLEYNDDISLMSSVDDIDSNRSMPIIVSFNNDYKGLISENEPIAKKDSRNAHKYFLKLVNTATYSIDGAFYDIQDPDMVSAFIKAKKRGVNVRLITDDANTKDREDPTKVRQTILDLRNAGISVIDDKRQKLMHHKFMIVDNRTVWTGSMNLTTSSMYHHNNNSMMIKSNSLAQNFNAEFRRMYDKNMFGPNPHEIPNEKVNVNGISIRTYFSPGGGTMSAILEEVKKAKKSVRFMAFSMTDKNLAEILIQKKQAGLKVEGIFDNCLIPQYSIYWTLKKAGILSLRDGNQALMHHKTMIIDDETVITGSFNFSKSAEEANNENTLIIRHQAIAKQYNAEYNRVRYAAFNNKNLPPYDHPACNKQEKQDQETPTPPIFPGQDFIPE